MDAYWSKVPDALYADTRLSDAAVRLYLALTHRADREGLCWPSRAALAGSLGWSERTVSRRLVELESAGWCERVRRRNLPTLTRVLAAPGTPAGGLSTVGDKAVDGPPGGAICGTSGSASSVTPVVPPVGTTYEQESMNKNVTSLLTLHPSVVVDKRAREATAVIGQRAHDATDPGRVSYPRAHLAACQRAAWETHGPTASRLDELNPGWSAEQIADEVTAPRPPSARPECGDCNGAGLIELPTVPPVWAACPGCRPSDPHGMIVAVHDTATR